MANYGEVVYDFSEKQEYIYEYFTQFKNKKSNHSKVAMLNVAEF